MILDIFNDLHRKICSRIIHGKYDTFNIQSRIQTFSYQIYGMDQLTQSLQRIVFALNRNKNCIRCRHRIDRQHAERRRAIDDDKIVLISNPVDFIFQNVLFFIYSNQFNLRCGKIDI